MVKYFHNGLDHYFREGDLNKVLSLCLHRFEEHGDLGTEFFIYIENAILKNKEYVLQNLKNMPSDFALRGVVEYGLGCIAASEFRLESTIEHLRNAFSLSMKVLDVFENEHGFCKSVVPFIAKEAYNLKPYDNLKDEEILLPKIKFSKIEKETDFFVLASCNGIYFDRYFEEFYETIRQHNENNIYHIHIANPTSQTEKLIAELDDPNFKFSFENTNRGASYFACMRLFIARRLMENYNCGCLVSDIDVRWIKSPSKIWAGLNKADFGWYPKPGPAPSLLVHAQIIAFSKTQKAFEILEKSNQFLAYKLSEFPSWCLDQSSLFRAVCLTPEAKTQDFRETLGDIETVQRLPDTSLTEKQAFRAFENIEISMNSDGYPILSRVD
ncbi:hypothetical protein [Terasakiella pusilla]|uniref:hypothetical protein n=1 Tax=Terasakiella pusilla TaxID=64973 RepID=UPI003AA8B7D7